MVGVDAIGNRRQQKDLGASLVGPLASPIADLFHFEIIGAIGHVQVMRLGGAEGQHRHFPALRAHQAVIRFCQYPFPHTNLSSVGSEDSTHPTCR